MFIKKTPPQVNVLQGSSLILCCEAAGSPRPNIEWFRAQQSLYSSLAFQENGCLDLNTTHYSSDGDYICQAKNSFGLAEATTAVPVNMKGSVFSLSVHPVVDRILLNTLKIIVAKPKGYRVTIAKCD